VARILRSVCLHTCHLLLGTAMHISQLCCTLSYVIASSQQSQNEALQCAVLELQAALQTSSLELAEERTVKAAAVCDAEEHRRCMFALNEQLHALMLEVTSRGNDVEALRRDADVSNRKALEREKRYSVEISLICEAMCRAVMCCCHALRMCSGSDVRCCTVDADVSAVRADVAGTITVGVAN
jgi:hypothetical protein